VIFLKIEQLKDDRVIFSGVEQPVPEIWDFTKPSIQPQQPPFLATAYKHVSGFF
jgi:hypothetical protein